MRTLSTRMFREAKQAFRHTVPIILSAPAKPSHNRRIENACWTLPPSISKLRFPVKITGINTRVTPTTKRPRRKQTANVAADTWEILRRSRLAIASASSRPIAASLPRSRAMDNPNEPAASPTKPSPWSPRFLVMYQVENRPRKNVTNSLPYVEHAFNTSRLAIVFPVIPHTILWMRNV